MTYRKSVLKNIPKSVAEDQYLLMGALGLGGEAGEVVDIVKKVLFHGKILDRDHLIEEMGDVRWYLEVLCEAMGITMDEVEQVNMDKLAKRYPNGFETKG